MAKKKELKERLVDEAINWSKEIRKQFGLILIILANLLLQGSTPEKNFKEPPKITYETSKEVNKKP